LPSETDNNPRGCWITRYRKERNQYARKLKSEDYVPTVIWYSNERGAVKAARRQ
jgi:hypothetical protein